VRATLLRNADTEFGVFGYLLLYNDAGQRLGLWRTMEDDWLDNQSNISCIPAGHYTCRRRWSPKHKCYLYEVEGVPGRDDIEIHVANTEEDVLGCIGLGKLYGALDRPDEDAPGHPVTKKWSVASSKVAVDEWMTATGGIERFPFVVEWSPLGAWRQAIAREAA
jgi:hypothetical protein